MTSHTDSVATHTPDSDLIDEPSPANTEAHGYSHTHAQTHQSGGHGEPIIITLAGMGNGSSAAMTLVNLMTKKIQI